MAKAFARDRRRRRPTRKPVAVAAPQSIFRSGAFLGRADEVVE